jgi:hypothetical protein
MGHLEALLVRLVPEEGFSFESAASPVKQIHIDSEFHPLIPEINLDELKPNSNIICRLSGEYLWLIHWLLILLLNQNNLAVRGMGRP